MNSQNKGEKQNMTLKEFIEKKVAIVAVLAILLGLYPFFVNVAFSEAQSQSNHLFQFLVLLIIGVLMIILTFVVTIDAIKEENLGIQILGWLLIAGTLLVLIWCASSQQVGTL